MDTFISILLAYPYVGIVALLVLTGMGLPLPEEVPVMVAGYLSATGQLDWAWALTACIVEAILGDSVVYAIGYHFGHSLVRRHRLLAKFLHAEREAYVEQLVQRHGLKVFFLARFLVGIRAPIYLATGTLRVPYRKFLIADVFSATIVVGLFFGLAYRYAEQFERVFRWITSLEQALTVVVVIVVAAAIGFYWWRRRRRWTRILARRQERIERTSVMGKEPADESQTPGATAGLPSSAANE